MFIELYERSLLQILNRVQDDKWKGEVAEWLKVPLSAPEAHPSFGGEKWRE